MVVFVEALNASFLAKMLLDDTHDRLLHALLQDVVLAGLVQLVEVLLLAFFIGIDLLLSANCGLGLLFEITSKHLVVLASQSLNCYDALLAEVIGGCLGEGPLDQRLGGDDLIRVRLISRARLRHDGVRQGDLEVDVGALGLEQSISLFLIDPDLAVLLSLLVGGGTCLEENATSAVVGTRLGQVTEVDPGTTEDRLHVIGTLTFLGRWGLLATLIFSRSLSLGQLHESEPAATIVLDGLFKLNKFKSLLLADCHAN